MSLKIKLSVLLLFVSIYSFSQTNVSGIINSNTTWSLANSPYTITGNILVNPGVTLTIEAGVTIEVNSGLGLQSSGEVIAIGTPSSRILFTSSSSNPSSGDWAGISLLNQSIDPSFDSMGNYVSGTIFKNVDIKYTGQQSWSGGIKATNADIFMDGCTITEGDQYGIFLSSTNDNLTIRNCLIENHTFTGIYFSSQNGLAEITDSKIENNQEHGLLLVGENFIVSDNLFRNNGTGFVGAAITVAPNGSSSSSNKIIRKNKFIDHERVTIKIEIGSLTEISQNIFLNTQRAVVTEEANIRVDSNVFVNNSMIIKDHRGKDLSMKYNHIINNNKANTPWGFSSTGLVISAYQGFNKIDFGFNTMVNNNFSSDRLLMLEYRNTSSVKINNNNLLNGNSQYFIYNNFSVSQPVIDAKNNYWGTQNTSEIDNRIFDWADNFNNSVVGYSPILSKRDTLAPISPPASVLKKLSSGSVQLNWLANPEEDVAGYKIYWSNPTGYSYDHVIDVGNVTSYLLNGVSSLSTEIAVVAYDNRADGDDLDVFEGHQSWFALSEQFSATVSSSNFNGSNLACKGDSNGQITLSITDGSSPYTYSWAHDSLLSTNQATNLPAGTYYYSITDSQGLSLFDSIVLTEPDSLTFTVSKSDILCAGSNDGAISFSASGGTAPFQYSINGGSSYSANSTFNGLAAGVYNLQILDGNNCVKFDTISLLQLGFLSLTLDSSSNPLCNGLNNGSISVTASGGILPYSYLWTNGDTIDDISNLTANFYTLTVTDASGCSQTLSHNITEPSVLSSSPTTSSFNGFQISCWGAADGSITLNPTGGTAPYSYSWVHDPSETSNSISNLDIGVYIFTITDDHLCSFSDTITINQADSLWIQSITKYPNNCSNGADGSLAFNVSGGALPYSFSLFDSIGNLISNSDSIGNLTHGNYTFSVIDANSCSTSTQIINLNYLHNPIKPIITAIDSVICAGTNTTLSLNPGIQSALWNDGLTGLSRNLPSGSYWVSSTDTSGCISYSDTILIEDLVALDTSAQICLVTYDPVLNKNKIIFDKPDDETGISIYNIYKDIFGLWQIIGTVNSGDSSQFIDQTSQPSSKVARYYIETEDQCGIKYSTNNSPIHKTVLLQSSIGSNNEVNLSWNHYEGASIWYYRILRSSVASGFVAIDSVGSSFNTYIDNSPPNGNTSYLIQAVLISGCTVKAKSNTYSSLTSNTVTENTIGLKELGIIDFNIYPNPTHDILNIEYKAGIESKEITLFDVNGKLIQWINSQKESIQIDLSDLPKGIYGLKITTKQGVISQSVIRN